MTEAPAHSVCPRPAKPLFGSKLLWLAVLATVAGLGWWIFQASQPVAAPTVSAPGAARSGFVTSSDSSAAQTLAPRPTAPMPFRMGLSFMGGFFLAWALKKFIKMTLLIGGAIAVLIAALKGTGVINLDWGAVESQVSSGMAAAGEHVDATKDVLLKYLPSGASAFVGMFAGLRRG
ncbi:MAG: FUN14 domain-containing protein [Phycisphaerae bacterium]|mgnify:CR=1 FL=1|nr:FUN14 domain-containing protein [Phycisphaerae bacterium]